MSDNQTPMDRPLQYGLLDPHNVDFVALCRRNPMFVPLVVRGVVTPVRDVDLKNHPPIVLMSPADFVLGLNALGYEVRIADPTFEIADPPKPVVDIWTQRAKEIRAAFGEERSEEVVAYIRSHSTR